MTSSIPHWQLEQRFKFIVIILLLILFFCLTWSLNSLAVCLTREAVEKLREEGKLNEWVNRWESAVKKGMYESTPPQLLRLAKIRSQDFSGMDTLRPLVLCVDFNDNVHTLNTARFDTLLFSKDFTVLTGSFRDYYLENSYGKHDPKGGVYGWVRVDSSYIYYTAGLNGLGSWPRNSQKLVQDALSAADPYVNFADYDYNNDGWIDGLMVVHAGPGAEETHDDWDIWSHRWSIGTQIRDGVYISSYTMQPEMHEDGALIDIGVFCHEWGHDLGISWEEYDSDYSSEGLGDWSVMSRGCFNDSGKTPAHHSALCKYYLGWTEVEVVKSNQNNLEIVQAETSPLSFRLWTEGNEGDQFFMVENRQKTGFDSHLPGSGLLIYHVDLSMSGNNLEWCPGSPPTSHYKIALEQVDGRFQLEGCYGFGLNRGDENDPFPGDRDKRAFEDTTIPNSRDYYANSTQVAVWNISDSDSVMYANLDVTWSRPNLALEEFFFDDNTGGDGDGVAEPEETVELLFSLSNTWKTLANAWVIASTDTEGISFSIDSVSLGDISSGETVNNYGNPLVFDVATGFPTKTVSFTLKICGDGGAYCRELAKEVEMGLTEILLVDDDGHQSGDSNYVTIYRKVLDSLKVAYEVWDKKAAPAPSYDLTYYPIIIWFTGNHRDSLLSSQDVANLINYLEGGGNLFLTSQDAAQKLSSSEEQTDSIFLADYLHSSYGGGCGRDLVVGVTKDPIGDTLYISLEGSHSADNQVSKDVLIPDLDASEILTYTDSFSSAGDSVAGIRYHGNFKLVFFGFGFEGMDSSGSFHDGHYLSSPIFVMERVLNWLRESSHVGTVMLDSKSYTGTDDLLEATVVDPDLDLNLSEADTVSIKITSTTDKAGISIICTETDTSSGTFAGSCGFTTGPSDDLDDLISVSDGDTVTAIYTDQNPYDERWDEAVWSEYKDTIPPTFTVGILQNPIISSELNIYTIASESLKTVPTVTIGTDTLDVDEISYEAKTIYTSIHKLTASGNIQIKVVGTDLADNEGAHTEIFVAGSFSPSGGYLVSHDNILRLDVGGGALEQDEYLLVMKVDTQDEANPIYPKMHSFLSPQIPWEKINGDNNVLATYSITPSRLRLKTQAKLSLSYDRIDLEERDPARLTIYRLDEDVWRFIPSYLDADKLQVVAFINDLGIYQLRYVNPKDPEASPKTYVLSSNYPNPFNHSTNIRYEIPMPGCVKIEIYNILGQKVKTLVDDHKPAGRYMMEWKGVDDRDETVSSGIYFYRMSVSDFAETKKMVFLK